MVYKINLYNFQEDQNKSATEKLFHEQERRELEHEILLLQEKVRLKDKKIEELENIIESRIMISNTQVLLLSILHYQCNTFLDRP